jgi:hypothetical protein
VNLYKKYPIEVLPPFFGFAAKVHTGGRAGLTMQVEITHKVKIIDDQL